METTKELALTNIKLAAGALCLGGRLQRITEDPASGRLTFHFTGLPAAFLEATVNDDVRVSLRGYMDALERLQGLVVQSRARRAR